MLRTPDVFVIPTLKQRPANLGQVIVVPVAHTTTLHAARPDLVTELFEVAARITAAAPAAFGATGSTVAQHNTAPDQVLEHLHVHVIPRFAHDGFAMPSPAARPAPRSQRAILSIQLQQALGASPRPVRPSPG